MAPRGLRTLPAARRVLLATSAVVFVSGCELLAGMNGMGADELASPSPIARYTSGTATIALGDGTKVTLTHLHGPAVLYKTFGATVGWENDAGWYLQFGGGLDPAFGDSSSYLTIDRIQNGEHWATRDPSRCIVDVAKVDATGISGTATCKGLQWQDAVSPYGLSGEPSPLPGQKPFDATITFAAAP